ncbi:TPA_asm: hypothetical protein GJJ46_08130 [Listeria monocytogenes]|nr:hypothetical protein [Listeria monocytogenes]HAC1516255.1 hypothetical protein [Listeria monocytogenes]HAC1527150.1 hypothetical protein [Listeria monocytogenes]HAC1913999.1 hypothetical protein [Listeria monocytogenes]HAC1928310.1 hypothetical protein [Listeria monocytogenes]
MAQNNVINIQLEESYQEFKIGTEIFKVGLGDEMRRKWIEADEGYKQKLDKLNKYNIDKAEDLTAEEYFNLEKDVKKALAEAYSILLNDEEAFDKCYSQCKDILKMYQVYDQVAESIVGSVEKQQSDIQKKYQAKMTKKAK